MTKAQNNEVRDLRYRLEALVGKAKDSALRHKDMDLYRAAEEALSGGGR